MDVEILEKFITIIDENQPILSNFIKTKYYFFFSFSKLNLGTFVFGIISEFGALLGPGAIKTALIE